MRLLFTSLFLAAALQTCDKKPTQPPTQDSQNQAGQAAGQVGQQANNVNQAADAALAAKEQAYKQLADNASKAAAAGSAAASANSQNPQQNRHTGATAKELAVVNANLPPPKPDDLAEANARLVKALSDVEKDRQDAQAMYNQALGEAKARQAQLDQANALAKQLTDKLTEERAKFDLALKDLRAKMDVLASEAEAARANELVARRALAAQTRQKMALGCGALAGVLFILALVGLALKVGGAASILALVGSVGCASAGVAITAFEDLLTKPWFWPVTLSLAGLVAAGVCWFGWSAFKRRRQMDVTERQAVAGTGAVEEMKNDAKLAEAKLAELNLPPEAKAAAEAQLLAGKKAWNHLRGYLDEWQRNPKTGEVDKALVDKIAADKIALNLRTANHVPAVESALGGP